MPNASQLQVFFVKYCRLKKTSNVLFVTNETVHYSFLQSIYLSLFRYWKP